MSGSLTLGGMADGLLSGQSTFGPSTITGNESISETINVELTANIDYTIKVPGAAVAFACFFTFQGQSGVELKLGSNLNATTGGFPVKAEGFLALPVAPGVTELKFRSATPPPTFQLVFI